MKSNKNIGVMILAAGSSSRLGYPKQLVQFQDKPLLQHVIDVAESLPFTVKTLVLGANSNEIRSIINPKSFKLVLNDDWRKGMATSIQSGLKKSLEIKPELEHIMILLSDQPFINTQKLNEIIETQLNSQNNSTFSEYNGQIGVPAIFSKELFNDLMSLEGDQGAKKLIIRDNIKYNTVRFEDGVFDIDTQEDVETLNTYSKK
ncbi:nucleotidyltransferase family protein [Flammeovirgaceae bacterium KN852]|uniref:Nucleotidyltransferase family protein n=2 Tax=Marinigracilibium pacificum TaxID=2729599 RepID=A0A848J574_9BACT|nr:nucleotidyltransferase family protein [Marinigracilibium pacificum]